MAEVNPADLRDLPSRYQSSRGLNDVLIGEDTALPLINTSSTGDITTLRGMLEQSPEIALESPHRIYHEYRPAKDKNDVRGVLAMKRSNLHQAILRAAENGYATAVSILLDFASRNGVRLSSVIDRVTIKRTIETGHAAVFEVLAMADPTVATHNDFQGRLPLDLAIASHEIEVARVILQHGGGREFAKPLHGSTYPNSRLCKATRSTEKTMTELLIQHGYAVRGSGALQMAADRGALDTIRLLVEEHGADVNERLPAETLPRVDNALFASWTPMHFAARWGKEEAMKLLESYGAKTDVLDVNGKTPSRLLEERKERSKT
ncbi:ankyrin [Dothidotthia symphoricarpi CBS 119687]|uniref:Ankyrin n=1 Tax=Dothidotthia symphoricarpi CBS 119687 TaxID=1392245 RepID=A0A6A6AKH0_9PLEO|nr:ankyrin [Dothidotthia symphoricarpi CBS 119687]KAF2132056.1 ankyrin [Dothidotthia symphoricarpi CBS 119687]